MTNLELALGSFWQFARHWKMRDTAKLELTCEGGNLQMNFSAKLGHPDIQHFQQEKPPPSSTSPSVTSPPLSCKRKTPSQLRRQDRRRCAALDKAAVKAATDRTAADKAASDKVVADKVAADKVAADKAVADKAIAEEAVADDAFATKAKSTEKKVAVPENFHCDLCNFKPVPEKGLKAHTTTKHKKECDVPINHLVNHVSTVASASSMTTTPSDAIKSKTSKSQQLCWFDKCKKLPAFQSLNELNSHIQNIHEMK